MDENDLEHLVDAALKAGITDPVEIAGFVRDWLTIATSNPPPSSGAETRRDRPPTESTRLH